MRKKQTWWTKCICLLLVAVMMVSASGCAKEEPEPEEREEQEEEVLEREPAEEEETEAVTEPAAEENPYEEILNMFAKQIAMGWIERDGNDWENVYDPDNVSYIWEMDPESYSQESVGYMIQDLNADGTDELIISTFYLSMEGQIQELYSICNGQVVHLASSGERYYYSLATDNTINYFGASSADVSMKANYRIDGKRGELAVNHALVHDDNAEGESPWFYTQREFVDPNSGEIRFESMENISTDEADQVFGRMPDTKTMTLTPISEHSSDMLEIPQVAESDGTLREEYRQILADHMDQRDQGYLFSGDYAGTDYKLEYTLYDIDKDGLCELIVREDMCMYYIYSRYEDFVSLYAEEFWSYDDCLYEYDGNGIIVHDGGMGTMRLEYVWLYSIDGASLAFADTLVSSEEVPLDEVYSFLEKQKPVEPLRDITDLSLLMEKV